MEKTESWASNWKPWTELNMWVNDPLIGAAATSILEIAKRHKDPVAPTAGGPKETLFPFDFSSDPADPKVEQLCRRVAILWRSLDLHLFWHTRKMVCTENEGDAAWTAFKQEAQEVVDAFMATDPFKPFTTHH